MAHSKDDQVAKLYEKQRIHPHGKPHDHFPSPHRAANRAEPHDEVQRNQFREDAHAPGYLNDHPNDWIRGRGESAEGKPSFDRKQAFRVDRDTGMRDQIKDRYADHNRHHTEFELSGKHGTTHAMEAHDASKRAVPAYERKGELGGDNSQPKHKRYDQG